MSNIEFKRDFSVHCGGCGKEFSSSAELLKHILKCQGKNENV